MHLQAHTQQASEAELLFLLILWKYPKVCCQVSSYFAFADPRVLQTEWCSSAVPHTGSPKHLCNKTQPTQSRALPSFLLIMPGWVSSCQKCPSKTAPKRGPACLISAWGSYMNFSFLLSPSFPQTIWASYSACINANMLPPPREAQASQQLLKPMCRRKTVEQMKQTSLSSTQCRLGTPLVWGRAGRGWLK